jgi:hypothetical protein
MNVTGDIVKRCPRGYCEGSKKTGQGALPTPTLTLTPPTVQAKGGLW